MPFRRFRGVEEMKAPRWREPGDPDLITALAALWEVGRRTSARRYPPGVHKYASIEEMQLAQERWAVRSSGS